MQSSGYGFSARFRKIVRVRIDSAKRAFTLALERLTDREIAARLGLPLCTLRGILTSPLYVGRLRDGGRALITEGEVPFFGPSFVRVALNGDVQFMGAELERGLQSLKDLLGGAHRPVGAADLWKQDDKFIPSQPRQRVVG